MFIKLTTSLKKEPIYIAYKSILKLKIVTNYNDDLKPDETCTEIEYGHDRQWVNVIESPEEIIQKINEVL